MFGAILACKLRQVQMQESWDDIGSQQLKMGFWHGIAKEVTEDFSPNLINSISLNSYYFICQNEKNAFQDIKYLLLY